MMDVVAVDLDESDVPDCELELYERYSFLQKFRLWYVVLVVAGSAVGPLVIWSAGYVPVWVWVWVSMAVLGYAVVGLSAGWLYKRQKRQHRLRAEKHRRRVPGTAERNQD